MIGEDNTNFCFCILAASALAIGFCYFLLVKRTGNFVNILTPTLLLSVPAYIILEFFYLTLFKYSGSKYAYSYIYATYVFGVIAKTIGYMVAPSGHVPLFIKLPKVRARGLPYFFLGLAYALYVPVLVEYSSFLAHPREIYALTRTGYGLQSFLSTFSIYVGFILLLFYEKRTSRLLGFFVVSSVLLYMHGSKGQSFYMLIIWLYFAAFVNQHKFGLGRFFIVGAFTSTILIGLFYLTSSEDLRDDFIASIAGYSSEYTRNAIMVIEDNDFDYQYGRIAFEDDFYSLIPRQLFPDKRKDFGVLWLANKYYPERFQDERGAPAFGLGTLYADFGPFAIFWSTAEELLSGIFLGILVLKLRRNPDAGTFFIFAIFMAVPLIPTGTGFPLIMYYLLAHIVKMLDSKGSASPTWLTA